VGAGKHDLTGICVDRLEVSISPEAGSWKGGVADRRRKIGVEQKEKETHITSYIC